MRILITGMDGYLGWSLAQVLCHDGHDVAGIDNFSRRRWVAEVGGQSILPIADMTKRLSALEGHGGYTPAFFEGDLCDATFVRGVMREFQPEAVVFLGQMPSAPYSMIDAEHALETQRNNVLGNLAMLFAIKEEVPECHLVKLGTMGEYGTPNLDIPEGFFEVTWRGRTDTMLFPRRAGSWYHQSKVHDTHNVEMACRLWGLRATDIMQGVVYGTRFNGEALPDDLFTRYDVDECFGTVINRFCAQAVIDMPLTIYGAGGQQRGFLPLRDSMACLKLALQHPADTGEYRTFNQFDQVYSVRELAEAVQQAGLEFGLNVRIESIENPRIEAEDHRYVPDREGLRELGYRPSSDLKGDVRVILQDLMPHRERIEAVRECLLPKVRWDPTVRSR